MLQILNYKESRYSSAFFLKSILLFGFIYPFSLRMVGIPDSLLTSRISAILFLLYGIYKGSQNRKLKEYITFRKYRKVLNLVIFTLVYTFLISLLIGFGRGVNYVTIVTDNLLFSLLILPAFFYVFKDLDEFADALIVVTIIQSVAVLLGTFIPAVSMFFITQFGTDGGYTEDIDLLHESYASGIACFTSEGVTRYTIGLVACAYKYMVRQKNIFLVLYIFFTVIVSMVARTGMLMAAIGVFFILSYLLKERKINFVTIIGIALVGILSYTIISGMSSGFFDRFKRYNEFKDGGVASFFDGYFHGETTEVPPISSATLFGTSTITGVSGNGVKVITDGGYIKNYVALGLPLSLIFYYCFISVVIRLKRMFKGYCIWYVLSFYLCYIVLSEFKEYFLLFRGHIMLFFLFVLLAEKKYLRHE